MPGPGARLPGGPGDGDDGGDADQHRAQEEEAPRRLLPGVQTQTQDPGDTPQLRLTQDNSHERHVLVIF